MAKKFTINEIEYTADNLTNGRWSIRVDDPDACDAISNGPLSWASDDEISSALGVAVRFVDAGDHPNAIESIYYVESERSDALE